MDFAPLKVLHLETGRGWRGGQQQSFYLHSELSRRGHHSILVCPPDSEIHRRCLKENLPCMPVAIRGEWDGIAGIKIGRLARKLNITFIQCHTAHALSAGLWAKLIYRPAKLIAVRRVDFSIKKNVFSIYKYTNSRLDKIVCISKNIKEVLRGDGIPDTKLTTIYSGIDLEKFRNTGDPQSVRKELAVEPSHFMVGTVAAFTGHKDYPNLLRAAKIVLEKRNDVTFCALGTGKDKEKILKLADDLSLGRRFIFAGFRDDVGSFLKSFDLFVMASRKEGLGTSILDAQLLSLPVVATRTGGIPEAVIDQNTGLLVPPGDHSALADSILKLLDDPDTRKRLGRAAKVEIVKFDINRTVDSYIRLYRDLTAVNSTVIVE